MQLGLAILTAVVSITLVLVVLAKNQRNLSYRFFAGLIFVNALYPIFNYLTLSSADGDVAFIWGKFAILTGVLTGPLFYFFVDSFPDGQLHMPKWAKISLVSWLLLDIVLLFSDLIFSSMDMKSGQPQLVVGPAIPLFGLLMILTLFGGSWNLIRKYKRSQGLARLQLGMVALGLIGGLGMTLVATIILPLGFGINVLLPISPIFLLFSVSMISYAILRRRLFNVGSLVARSVAYILMLITIAVLYGITAFAMASLLVKVGIGDYAQQWVNICIAVVVAFSFQPLRTFFERSTDRIFYRYRYDSRVVLNNLSKILVSELDLDRIMERSLEVFAAEVKIQYAQLAIFNRGKVFRVEHLGKIPQRLMVGPEMLKLNRVILIADELHNGNLRKLMDDHGIRVSLMLRTREEFVGYLLLGDKLSGESYSKQDLELLEIIAKQLAVAILNAKAYIEIQEFNRTLQARVDHATKRIRIANRHLKELDKAKDEFISMASHQLRTPLTTIKGYLSMILDGDAGEISPTQREFVDFAFGASERMVNLISDLLNVSRLSAGRFLIQTKPTDMVAMIQDEVRQLKTHATAKGIDLIFVPPAKPLPLVEIDENKTRQVIMNFIDNAIYYTQVGNVTLTLEQSGELVRLTVRDTGIGVPEKAKKKLFSKFFRAENAQTVRPDGTGLGLYLARRVINDQGGTIIFDSSEGHGSTFGFELPIKPAINVKNPKR